jgi:hypothetical protein
MKDPSQAMLSKSIQVGRRTYELRYTRCGKRNCSSCYAMPENYAGPPGHGPYWYLCFPYGINSQWRRIYIGKELSTNRFVTADGCIDFQAIDEARRQRARRKSETPISSPEKSDSHP